MLFTDKNVWFKHICLVFWQPYNLIYSRNVLLKTVAKECILSSSSHRSWCDGSSGRSFMGWTHWAISHSSQCSTTGITKAVVCAILSGMVHIKEPLLLIVKSSPCGGSGFISHYLNGPLPYVWCHITVNKMCWVHR